MLTYKLEIDKLWSQYDFERTNIRNENRAGGISTWEYQQMKTDVTTRHRKRIGAYFSSLNIQEQVDLYLTIQDARKEHKQYPYLEQRYEYTAYYISKLFNNDHLLILSIVK